MQEEFEFQHLIDDGNFSMEFHCHDHIEIFLSVNGGKSFIIDDKIYDMKPGDLFVNNQLEVHRTIAEPGKKYERYVLSFHHEFLQPFCTPESDLLHYVYRRPEGFSNKISLSETRLKEFMGLLCRYEGLCNDEFANDVLRRMVFVELLALTARFYQESIGIPAATLSPATLDPIGRLLEYISANITEELNLDILADEIGMSKFHLCKIFKAKTGTTINKYIVTRRIAEAKHLLMQGAPVTDACYRSGFNDLSHFIRTFHNAVGVPPGKYLSVSSTREANYYFGPEREK